MKMLKTFFSLTLTVAFFAPAAQAQSATKESDQVKSTLVAMWDAIEKGDVARYASYVHPDFTAFGESDTYLASGKDLEIRGITSYLQRFRDVHTEMHHPSVTVRGDVAWITYYWTDEGFSVDGERVTSQGKSTRIFVKENGKWLCIHGHYTSVP